MIANDSNPVRKAVRIFQSYGWRDAGPIAQRLKASLVDAGFDVWIDRENLREDDRDFAIALENAVKDCEIVVALLSPQSVRGLDGTVERSSICYNEIRLADELQRPIVPVRVRKFAGPPPFLLIKYRQIDWLSWEHPDAYKKGLGEIVTTIEQLLAKETNFDPDIAFQATNFAPQLRTARDDFVGRDWLFSRLDEWLDGPAPCFLLEGATGSGKTAIVAELVRRNPSGRILAYHFCSAVTVTVDPAAFVRSLAGMLATSIDAYAEQLWNGKLAGWLTAADPRTMLSQGVLAPLRDLRMDGNFYIVLDALDEAFGAAGLPISLPQLLAAALDEFPPWLKLFATTRPHARVRRLFRGAETRTLGFGIEEQRMDVRAYVGQRLAEPSLQAIVSPEERGRVGGLIEDQVAGSFQYAGSILDALSSGELTLRQLNHLPSRLEDFYYARAQRRFPNPPDYRLPRILLGVVLAAREPLTLRQLSILSGLDHDAELQPALDALSCFLGPDSARQRDPAYRIAHTSIADWLLSHDAGEFQIDPVPGRERILTHCLGWRQHHETYALKHVPSHLLEAGRTADALDVIRQGLFADRLAHCNEPRLDTEDSRNLTLALVAARDEAAILTLARTENTWQRDGVAAALQSTSPDDLKFVDHVVGALLELSA